MTSATLEPVINFDRGAEPHRQTQLNLRSTYSIASSNTSPDRKKELHLETFQIVRIQIEVEVEGCLEIRSASFLSYTVKSRNIWLSYFRYNLYFRFRLFVGLFIGFSKIQVLELADWSASLRHVRVVCVICVDFVRAWSGSVGPLCRELFLFSVTEHTTQTHTVKKKSCSFSFLF